MQGRGQFMKPLRIRGPEAVVQGEYTMVFLREPDLGRLRYGLVTRNTAGQLEVHDPAMAARASGDTEAAQAWEAGIGALPPWTPGKAERTDRNTLLLDSAAVETMWAAAAELAARRQKEEQDKEEE